MLRQTSLVIGTALISAVGSTWAAEPSRQAKAEEILLLSKSDQMMKQALTQVRAMQTQQMSRMNLPDSAKARAQEIQTRIGKLIEERLTWDRLKPEYVNLYASTFTDQELDGILAFYRGPAGKAFVEKMPQLMAGSMQLVQKLMGDIQPEIQKIISESGNSQ